MYEDWLAEADALQDTSHLNHPHMIQVKSIITRGKRHYFMFQWADGGSLRDFYLNNKQPTLDSQFIREVLQQLHGLASALNALHNYKGSYRHGDLKPENILRFKDETRVGILKIADMGLAKHHIAATGQRGRPTISRFGTPSYEPPEVTTMPDVPRSRLYDIWSMGCICLELIIWLLYGSDTLLHFNNSLKIPIWNAKPYWWIVPDTEEAQVHPNVIACIEHILDKDPEAAGPSAIRDLLEVVQTKLLVILLPLGSRTFTHLGSTLNSPGAQGSRPRGAIREPGPSLVRGDAVKFCIALEKILEHEEESYWCRSPNRKNVADLPIQPIIHTGSPVNKDQPEIDPPPTEPMGDSQIPEGPAIRVSFADEDHDVSEPTPPQDSLISSPKPNVSRPLSYNQKKSQCSPPTH